MILPDAVDAQIFAGIALPHETGLLQKPHRSAITGNTGGFEAVQPQAGKGKRDDRAHGPRHVALADKGQTGPVAETAGLRDAAPDIGKRQAADQGTIAIAGDEKGVALVAAQILGVAFYATAESRPREIVDWPGRLPGREKITACFAQRRPFLEVGQLRRAQ